MVKITMVIITVVKITIVIITTVIIAFCGKVTIGHYGENHCSEIQDVVTNPGFGYLPWEVSQAPVQSTGALV